MIKNISIFIMLLNTTFIYSQYEFGISKSELINKIGAPDDIRETNNDIIYEYQIVSPSQEFSVKNYFFNEYNELKEVQILYIFSNCYNAKDKLNKLLSFAKRKYSGSVIKDNKMYFKNNNSQEAYYITIIPQNLGDNSCYAEERYLNFKYL